ncbi:MAG: acyl-CoA dehydrogenase family protein [Deltaproteobacteria bacterium]|nr:acyl-CoA dehydrogenase family protein [Deltaproteobacteria bacterium]
MNFDLDAGQEQVRKNIRSLMDGEPEPFALPEDFSLEDLYQVYRDLLGGLRGSGYLELGTSSDPIGGAPYADYSTIVLAGEELARRVPALYLGLETSIRLAGGVLARYGTEAQKARYLAPLLQGDLLGTVALREALGNFPAAGIATQAEQDGRGYFLTGTKKGVVLGGLADWLVVPAMTGGRLGLFLIPSGSDGLAVSNPGRILGYEQAALAEVKLLACPVREEEVLGFFEPEEILSDLRIRENLAIAVSSLGVMHQALFSARACAARTGEGGKPPLAQQEIRYRLADMFTLLQTSQFLAYRAAWMLEAAVPEAATVAAAAKVFITEAAEEVTRGAMQITALDGYLGEAGIEARFREARFGPVAGETSEVLRMRIADECLKKFA